MGAEQADAVREAKDAYEAALTALGFSSSTLESAFLSGLADATHLPGALQTSVLAGLLGSTGRAEDQLVRLELAFLQRASNELELPAEAVEGAVATAILCGAADEKSALAALGHIPALEDADLRIRVARWLHDLYPPVTSGPAPYWNESLPDPLAEDLVAAVVTPRFLMGLLMETTEEQDRRALTVLARAADIRPALRVCLTELLSVLPGTSPAAVDVALRGGYPGPLAGALTSLAENAALPAELLETVPAGSTVLGEFPVLLAESLVEAYERRIESYPKSALRGLTTMLIELAERLSDLGRPSRQSLPRSGPWRRPSCWPRSSTFRPVQRIRCAGPPNSLVGRSFRRGRASGVSGKQLCAGGVQRAPRGVGEEATMNPASRLLLRLAMHPPGHRHR